MFNIVPSDTEPSFKVVLNLDNTDPPIPIQVLISPKHEEINI